MPCRYRACGNIQATQDTVILASAQASVSIAGGKFHLGTEVDEPARFLPRGPGYPRHDVSQSLDLTACAVATLESDAVAPAGNHVGRPTHGHIGNTEPQRPWVRLVPDAYRKRQCLAMAGPSVFA